MYSPPAIPTPPNQGKSAPSTMATPFIQADYPHDTFRATPTPPCPTDKESVGKGTKGMVGMVNKVPPRCS